MLYTCDYSTLLELTISPTLLPRCLDIYAETVEKTKFGSELMANRISLSSEVYLNIQTNGVVRDLPVWFRGYIATVDGATSELDLVTQGKLNTMLHAVATDFGNTPIRLNVARYQHGNTLPRMIAIRTGDQGEKDESTTVDGNPSGRSTCSEEPTSDSGKTTQVTNDGSG
jgi:hypothetical protein